MPRLFFALWPDVAVRDALYAAAQTVHPACGGRLLRHAQLHQTLVFLGAVADDKRPRLDAIAAAVRVPAFRLDFGVIGYWPHNRIIWAAPNLPPPLTALVATLEQGLHPAGIGYDRRDYVPHVTLVRDARAPASLPVLRVRWPVADFVLVESARGPRGAEYRVAARWPLTG